MNRPRGFTLIEVIIALAIVAIALVAASRAASLTIDSAADARLRFLAGLTVANHAADLRLQRRAGAEGVRTFEATQASETFIVRETVASTSNAFIKRVEITSASRADPARSLTSTTLYLPTQAR